MKKVILSSFAIATTMSCMAQNSVTISQTGGSGNTVTVQQSGSGSRIVVKQQSGGDTTSKASVNHLRIEAPVGTRTTIQQAGPGPNVLEISPEARPTAIIRQQSAINENTITEIQPKATPKSPSANPRKKP